MSVLLSSRTGAIGLDEYGEYECCDLMHNVAKYLPYSVTFKRILKAKHEVKTWTTEVSVFMDECFFIPELVLPVHSATRVASGLHGAY